MVHKCSSPLPPPVLYQKSKNSLLGDSEGKEPDRKGQDPQAEGGKEILNNSCSPLPIGLSVPREDVAP
jgi:hypothetical protein